jgi:catechol 2,3-dioxygenase-like lactoylglutathione lyase family enzyme
MSRRLIPSLALGSLLAATLAAVAGAASPPAEVIGTGPLFHIVGDIDKSVAFYRGLLGAPANNAGPRTFTADPELQELYHLPGGRESASVVRVPGLGLSLEFVEWRDVDRTPAQPRIQDPGATVIILTVRDIDAMTTWLAQHGAAIITPGGKPVPAGATGVRGRVVFARDPDGDGFFIEVRQPDTLPDSVVPPPANVIDAAFAVTIDNTDKTMRVYRDALGFHVDGAASFEKGDAWTAAAGIPGAEYRKQTALVPGSTVRVDFVEFRNIDRKAGRSRIQDPGTSMLQFSVRDISATVKALKESGAVVVTAGGGSTLRHGSPISHVRDPNNFFLEPMQPAPK